VRNLDRLALSVLVGFSLVMALVVAISRL